MHILSRVYPYAGTEKKVIQLLHHLDRSQFVTYLLSLTDFWEDPRDYLDADISTFYLNKQPGIQWRLVFTLATVLRGNQIDIIHSHNWTTLFHSVLAARLARTPVIIHGEHGRDTKELDQSWKRTVLKKKLFQLTDKMVVVAGELKDILINEYGVEESKIEFIPNGVEIERFNSVGYHNGLREKFNIKPSTKVLATVAKLRPVKDIPTLIKMFKIIHDQIDDSRLIIAGSTDGAHDSWLREVNNLVSSMQLQNDIIFSGNVDNIPEFLSIVDLYVNTSVSEGMSNTILEAMTAKRPVVASRVGGNMELVRDGITGYLFEAENEKDCAEKALKILTDPKLGFKMGEAARRIVEEQHDMETMIKRNENLYIKLYKEKVISE